MQKRPRIKQISTLANRLAAEATRLREMAASTTNSIERQLLLRRAEQYDAAEYMDGYLRSNDLQPPA